MGVSEKTKGKRDQPRRMPVLLIVFIVAGAIFIPAAAFFLIWVENEDPFIPGCDLPQNLELAFTREGDGGATDIFFINADGEVNLTKSAGFDYTPVWSPDGEWLSFTSSRDPQYELYLMRADGSEITPIAPRTLANLAWNWSPDGQTIAYTQLTSADTWNLFLYDVVSQTTRNIIQATSRLPLPTWSPDGRYGLTRAVQGDQTNTYLILPDRSISSPAGVEGANYFTWSPDSTAFAYVINGVVYRMTLATGRTIPLGNMSHATHPTWSPDGRYIAYRESPIVRIIDADTGFLLMVLGADDPIDILGWSVDSQLLVLATATDVLRGNTIFIADPASSHYAPLDTGTLRLQPGTAWWSLDGGHIVYVEHTQTPGDRLWHIFPVNGGERITITAAGSLVPGQHWSPDGQFFVHEGDRWLYLTQPVTGYRCRLTRSLSHFDTLFSWRP